MVPIYKPQPKPSSAPCSIPSAFDALDGPQARLLRRYLQTAAEEKEAAAAKAKRDNSTELAVLQDFRVMNYTPQKVNKNLSTLSTPGYNVVFLAFRDPQDEEEP